MKRVNLETKTVLGVADFEWAEPHHQPYGCYTAPVRQSDGAMLGRLSVACDIRRQCERGACVATLSHELHSPLMAIVGYTGTHSPGGHESACLNAFM